jgi:uncharacterized protein (TIGR02265 family)
MVLISSSPPHGSTERLEFENFILSTPEKATVKGMYVESFLRTFDQRNLPRPSTQRYVTFKDYPLRDYMRMLLDACPVLYPGCSLREGLKRQGRLVYPTLLDSTVGRVIFAIAGRNWQMALPLASRGWEISLKPGSAHLFDVTPKSAVLALRDIYNFADTYQVGIMEGAMETFLIEGTVVPRLQKRACDVDLVMQWK